MAKAKRTVSAHNFQDLTGCTFGTWTAVRMIDRMETGGRTFWLCWCECGNERVFNAGNLKRGLAGKCKKCSQVPLKDRLLARLERVGSCLEWMGARQTLGYGIIYVGNRQLATHRVAYQIYHGIDPGNRLVCHACDNPPCCRKSHLFLGTHADNTQDMLAKERNFRGEECSWALLDEKSVLEIRRRNRAGEGYTKLSRVFKVHEQTIARIVRRETWKHLGG